MRNQQEIYIQTNNGAYRNKSALNVNMSADFCVFETPTYDIPSLISVQCDPSLLYLTGYSLNDIFVSATTECFGTGGTACYCATTWTTKIYEDNVMKYNGIWYTTNTLNDVPTDLLFITSVENGFNTLDYIFTKTGTTYQIDKVFGTKELKIDICVSFKSKSGATFGCPSGYISNINNDGCQKVSTASTIFNGLGPNIVNGNTTSVYGEYGTFFYPNVQTNGALPLYYIGSNSDLLDQTGGTITALNINNDPANTFWYNNGDTTSGRLNQVGLAASSLEWLGFSKCIDIPFSGIYYVGLAADNLCRFYLNGELIVNFSGVSVVDNFKKWSVFPVELKSGKNIIEMYGRNAGSSSAFGAEIYAPIDYQTLTGATFTGVSGANVIFSTKEFVGGQWELGTTIGYSCPVGYSLDTCSPTYVCTQILRTGYTTTCSGNCPDDCYEVSKTNFQFIDNNSSGVYIIPLTGSTLIDTLVDFTSNIDGLTNLENINFRYELYKFDQNLGLFIRPATYVSENISYSAYTECVSTYLKYAEAVGLTNESNSIPLSESEEIEKAFEEIGCSDLFIDFNKLAGDGDYLLKIYYEFDACTDFLKRLGKKIDTSIYDTSSRFRLYNQEIDKYFVGVFRAESPSVINTIDQVIPQETQFSNLPLFQETFIITADTPYNITGSTLIITNPIEGDVIVTLNGLVLSKNNDYFVIPGVPVQTILFSTGYVPSDTPSLIQFYDKLEFGDVVTVIYTRIRFETLITDSVLVNSTIPSGTTNNQGSNRYYYNTTTQKYEIYLKNTPIDGSRIFLLLNGVALIDNIDYYKSVTNKKRIILEGQIYVNDILTAVYYPSASVIGEITQAQNFINWSVQTPPQTNDGEFAIEFSQNENFSNYNTSDIVQYTAGTTTYGGLLTLSGSTNTEWYYRVKNHKKYVSICGDIVDDVAYSETVKVKITTNSVNSY